LSQNVVHSDSDLILHNSSVLIDKEPRKTQKAVHGTMGDSSGLACIRQSLSKLYRFLYIIESKRFCQRFLSGY
ncbi:hypothetical protein SKA49_12920, partial [Enterococcus faecium]